MTEERRDTEIATTQDMVTPKPTVGDEKQAGQSDRIASGMDRATAKIAAPSAEKVAFWGSPGLTCESCGSPMRPKPRWSGMFKPVLWCDGTLAKAPCPLRYKPMTPDKW